MGGSAEFGGTMVIAGTIDRGATVAVAKREDRNLCVHFFRSDTENSSRAVHIDLSAIADASIEELGKRMPERSAGLVASCLLALHQEGLVNLRDERHRGLDLAAFSTIPVAAGLGSSAALLVATMMNLREHFNLVGEIDPMRLAVFCRRVESDMAGVIADIAAPVGSCVGGAGCLVKLLCQPHELVGSLQIAAGIRIVAIDTGVRRNSAGAQFERTRCAALMGHKMIFAKMDEMGRAAGLRLVGDPMRGYLANLALNDYKQYFRQFLPEKINGGEFIAKFEEPTNAAMPIDAAADYAVQSATDHHVHEPSRVKNFIQFMEQAAALSAHSPQRSVTLDKAGHLMYASHVSCSRDAMLGVPEADLLVDLVRKNERAGLYGAKITARAQGGTVAVLANDNEKASGAITAIVAEYQRQTGKAASIFRNSGPGTIEVGTQIIAIDG